MKIAIKCRFTGKILFEGEYESTKHAVTEAVKSGAFLRGAFLRGADLRGANLYGANLYDANLYGANLYDANLYGAFLRGADLRGANLSGANLSGAFLSGAFLSGAFLRGADLRGADLRGAKVDGEEIHIQPVQIAGLRWDILITGEYLRIGCQRHTHKQWADFKRTDISAMADKAWDWWKIYGEMLLSLCEKQRLDSEKVKQEKEAV